MVAIKELKVIEGLTKEAIKYGFYTEVVLVTVEVVVVDVNLGITT